MLAARGEMKSEASLGVTLQRSLQTKGVMKWSAVAAAIIAGLGTVAYSLRDKEKMFSLLARELF